MTKEDSGFIIFDKSARSVEGLRRLLSKYPDPTAYVNEWLTSDAEILVWVLAVQPKPCRVMMLNQAADLLAGALEELAASFDAIGNVRIATGPLEPSFAKQVRQRWRDIGGLVVDQ